MFTIFQTLIVIEQQLSLVQPHYAKVRAERAELLPFATPADLLAALGRSSALPSSARYAILGVLLHEHRSRPHPLWPALLMSAFAPMLIGLRARLGDRGDEDLDQSVLVAFLHAIETIGIDAFGEFAAIAIRRATAKLLFGRQDDEPELVPFDEDVHSPCDPFALTEAERRIDAVWAERRAARIHGQSRARVRKLPGKRRVAA